MELPRRARFDDVGPEAAVGGMELGMSRCARFDDVGPEAAVGGMELGMSRRGGLDESWLGAEPTTASSKIGRNAASGQRASFPNGQ